MALPGSARRMAPATGIIRSTAGWYGMTGAVLSDRPPCAASTAALTGGASGLGKTVSELISTRPF